MKGIKNSDHIRIRGEDKKVWKEYCQGLGTNSPDLFSKIMKSQRIDLNKKIIEEMRKREEEIRRRLRK